MANTHSLGSTGKASGEGGLPTALHSLGSLLSLERLPVCVCVGVAVASGSFGRELPSGLPSETGAMK